MGALRNLLAAVTLMLAGYAPCAAAETVRWHGILVRTANADGAAAFYENALGYTRAQEWRNGALMRLSGEEPFYIEQGRFDVRPLAVDESRASIAFRVNDLDASIERMRTHGVHMPFPEPFVVGVGRAMRFQDSDGNTMSLLQQTSRGEAAFAEPQIYNTGFKIPDAAMSSLRRLYAETLGFSIMTERYYPPSLPLLNGDGSFGFMIHENERDEPEIRPRSHAGLRRSGLVLIFASDDINATHNRLRALRDLAPRVGPIKRFALGRRFAFLDTAGVVSEIWQVASP